MKKFAYLTAIVCSSIALISCGGNKSKTTNTHTAENSLDYYGIYTGTTPAADCPGIKQTLTLNKDCTYTLNSVYIDREGANVNEVGTFAVEGNIATLTTTSGELSYFKIEESRVAMLMSNKQPITGAMADLYILKQEKVY